jgi:hypothetical protein
VNALTGTVETAATDVAKLKAVMAAVGEGSIATGASITIDTTEEGNTLNVPAAIYLAIGNGGSTAAKVTLNNATLAGGTLAGGATGTLTLAVGNTLTLADGGSIVVANSGKVILPNTEFNAGTYTAVGEVKINAKAVGDEIVTTTTANGGLILGTISNTSALKLLTHSATAANYTFKKSANTNKVTLSGTSNGTITIPANSTAAPAGDSGANVSANANASIIFNAGSILLGKSAATSGNGAGYLDLAATAKIGVFGSYVASNEVFINVSSTKVKGADATDVGTSNLQVGADSTGNSSGTLTVKANGVKIFCAKNADGDVTSNTSVALATS